MNVIIREFTKDDIPAITKIWNEVVKDGVAFPQIDLLNEETALDFFASQSFTGVAENTDTSNILGLYILHPNNVGRCGHISNASYAVSSKARGFGIGKMLVKHSMVKGKELGFKILQFNAVVKSNKTAIHLYEQLGFERLGVIKNGFLLKNGNYEDIIPFYHTL